MSLLSLGSSLGRYDMEVEIESHRPNIVLLHPNSSTMKQVLVTGKYLAGPSAGKTQGLGSGALAGVSEASFN